MVFSNASQGVSAGMVTLKVVPLPGSDCMLRLPPSSRALSWSPASPSLPRRGSSLRVPGSSKPLPLSLMVTVVPLSLNSILVEEIRGKTMSVLWTV